MHNPTLSEQITELKLELALRERVYPGFIERGRMKQAEADRSMARMQAALHTLMGLAELRASFGEKIGTPAQIAPPP